MKRFLLMGCTLGIMGVMVMAEPQQPAGTRPQQPPPRSSGTPSVGNRPAGTPQAGNKAVPQMGNKGTPQMGNRTVRRMPDRVDREPQMSESDQKLLETIEESESLRELIRLSRRASMSRHPEIRMAMVDALEARGTDAAEMVAAYIADPDEDVSESAFTAWTSLVNEMKPSRRAKAIVAAAAVLQDAQRLYTPEVHGMRDGR